MKKGLLSLLVGILALLLVSCGETVDHYMEGYDAVDAGHYEEALLHFQKAADQGDEQAATAADIVSGYLNAQEAYELGDLESAKVFLEDLPENYKYYAIGEDVDSLRQKVYAGILPEGMEKPKETDLPDMDDYLSQIDAWVQQGDLASAKEMLENIPDGSLTKAQMQWVVKIHQDIAEKEAELSEEPKPTTPVTTLPPALSPEKAAEYLKIAYPEVEGDIGGALLPQYDENDEIYYAITIQVREGEIRTIHIFPDGSVKTIK